MKKIKFVYFDLGGVIVDHISGLIKTAKKLNLDKTEVILLFKKHANDLDRGSLSLSELENIFDKKFNVSFKKTFKTIITDLEQKEFIRISQDRCALNPRGMLLQDSITANIIDLIPSSTS